MPFWHSLCFSYRHANKRKEFKMGNELKSIETLAEVCDDTTMQSPGVFILSKDGDKITAIGRSENNVGAFLRNRLGEFREKYKFYRVEPTYSSLEAFILHCRLYHKHLIGQHPEPPREKPNWGCPVLGCKWEESRKVRIKTPFFRQPALANAF
jgi:hypothetical protein